MAPPRIGAKPRRTSRTESTSLTTFSLIFVREDRPRSAEFAPARDFGSEGWGFESLRARYFITFFGVGSEVLGLLWVWNPRRWLPSVSAGEIERDAVISERWFANKGQILTGGVETLCFFAQESVTLEITPTTKEMRLVMEEIKRLLAEREDLILKFGPFPNPVNTATVERLGQITEDLSALGCSD
jgi:hypothetical protein